MAKLTIEDLKRIREKARRDISLREDGEMVRVTVHMGSCGIAAGAREVMTALLEEMAAIDRLDIRVLNADCLGLCDTEPNVTVETEGQSPVVYQRMDGERMRQVFEKHVLQGEVQTDFILDREVAETE